MHFNTGASSVIEEPLLSSGGVPEVPQYGAKYSREDEAEFVQRMKAGDLGARDRFVECLQPFVCGLARKYAAAYSWASAFMDYENILSELNYRLVVLLVERDAATFENPSGYVRTALARSIASYCFRYASPVTLPQASDIGRTPGATVVSVVSLDAPLSGDTGDTLADVIMAPSCTTTKTAMTSEEDYRDLYGAMSQLLSPKQQLVVNARYGLNQMTGGDCPSSSSSTELRGIYTKLRKALTLPEVTYARELEAWNAGNQTLGKFSAALGVGTNAGARRLELMRRACLIECKPRAIEFARAKDAIQRGTSRTHRGVQA